MKVTLKQEFYEWSIGGGHINKKKLKNHTEEEWLDLYNKGFKDFFSIKKDKKENDINKQERDQEGIL